MADKVETVKRTRKSNGPGEDASPQDRWKFFAENRLGRAVEAMQSLAKLTTAVPGRYYWSVAQADFIVNLLEQEMKSVKEAYSRRPVEAGGSAVIKTLTIPTE